MVQTGDPTGTGKGGTSIWGDTFEDSFNETLKVWIPVCVYILLQGSHIFAHTCSPVEKSLAHKTILYEVYMPISFHSIARGVWFQWLIMDLTQTAHNSSSRIPSSLTWT